MKINSRRQVPANEFPSLIAVFEAVVLELPYTLGQWQKECLRNNADSSG